MTEPTNTSLTNVPGGLLVAVDGPSGAGKSTVCRELAARLGAKYLDTGAMYRVATLHVLRQGVDTSDAAAVAAATRELPLEVNDDPASKAVLLNGEDVSGEIRSADVTREVSAVSAVPQVRTNLVALQRNLATQARRCVLDGRDIGTNVFPDAPAKIFLTASAQVRARRRYEQDLAAGRAADFDAVLADVERRDHADATRATNPLRPAEDAVVIDTSALSAADVCDALYQIVLTSTERTNR